MSTAIYIVTNLMPQNDPLRVSIRELSIRLLSLIGPSSVGYSPKEISTEIGGLCKKISAMFEIAFFSGYISEMNFSVLKSELDIFTAEISDYEGSQKIINPDFLKFKAQPDSTYSKLSLTESGTSNGPSKGQKNSKPKKALKSSPQNAGQYRSESKGDRPSSSRGLVETKRVSRVESILSIIRLKGEVSIKDISSVVINCSEKTIQRELIALVEKGTLKKSGDRRWSVYSLVS